MENCDIMKVRIFFRGEEKMEDSSGQSLLFQFILLLILTLLSAFFSASEMALVSLNRSRV